MICQSLSTEHPRLWANRHMVSQLSFGSLGQGGGSTLFRKQKIRFGSSTLFCNFSKRFLSIGRSSYSPLLKAVSAMPVRAKLQNWEEGDVERGHINEPGLRDPRVLYRRRPRRNSLNRSRITRDLSSLRPARIQYCTVA